MTLRLLRHGAAGCSDNVAGLEPGRWEDMAPAGQFLLDLEFLVRCSPTSGTASCIYCRSPPYLAELAALFPWIHFFAYQHEFAVPDYDPADPGLTSAVPVTVQVDYNKTMSAQEFTKDMARVLGERGARERESLLLICHGLDSVRQLALQVLMRPQFALLDICGLMPADYLDGEIVLPLYLSTSKLFACLAVPHNARSRSYDQDLYKGELGTMPAPALAMACRPK